MILSRYRYRPVTDFGSPLSNATDRDQALQRGFLRIYLALPKATLVTFSNHRSRLITVTVKNYKYYCTQFYLDFNLAKT
jgi:hypothetical protein